MTLQEEADAIKAKLLAPGPHGVPARDITAFIDKVMAENARLSSGEALRSSEAHIALLKHDAETLLTRAERAEAENRAMREAGQFLTDRLDEYWNELEDGQAFTQFNGNVQPALARFRAALATKGADSND